MSEQGGVRDARKRFRLINESVNTSIEEERENSLRLLDLIWTRWTWPTRQSILVEREECAVGLS